MTASASLERRYRQLLAWYPQAFRLEHEQEILAVLMASAGGDQRRPGWAESADLLRSATWMRLRPGAPNSPRSVSRAVRLMYVGAALELVALATVLLTRGNVKSAVLQINPHLTAAQWHAVVHAHIVPLEFGAPLAAVLWIWLAWANGRGRGWARFACAALVSANTVSLLSGLAGGAARYATADAIVGGALSLVGLAALALVFDRKSGPYFGPQHA